jgi:hypothetical protein
MKRLAWTNILAYYTNGQYYKSFTTVICNGNDNVPVL